MQKHQQWWPSWISDQHKNINLVGHQTINPFFFFKCHGIVVSEMKKLTGNTTSRRFPYMGHIGFTV
jgi:hypothetical protein